MPANKKRKIKLLTTTKFCIKSQEKNKSFANGAETCGMISGNTSREKKTTCYYYITRTGRERKKTNTDI